MEAAVDVLSDSDVEMVATAPSSQAAAPPPASAPVTTSSVEAAPPVAIDIQEPPKAERPKAKSKGMAAFGRRRPAATTAAAATPSPAARQEELQASVAEEAGQQILESESSLSKLRLELDASKAEVAEGCSKASGVAKHVAEDASSLRSQFGSMQEKLKTAEAKLAEKNDELSKAQKDLQVKTSAAEKAGQRNSEFESRLKQLNSQLDASRAEVANLRSRSAGEADHAAEEVASLKVQLLKVQEKSKAAETRQLEDRSALNTAQAKLAERTDELNKSHEDLRAKTFAVEKAGRQLSESESSLKTLTSELDISQAEVAQLRSRVSSEAKQVTDEAVSLRAQLSDVQDKLKVAEVFQLENCSALNAAQAELSEKTERLSKSQNELHAKTFAFEKTGLQLSQSESQSKHLGAELDACKAKMTQLRSEASVEAQHAAQEAASVQARLSEVQQELKATEARQSKDCSALKAAQTELTEKTDELTKAQKEVQAKTYAADKADQRISESESSLKRLGSELDASKAEVAELRSNASCEAKRAAEEAASLQARLSDVKENLKVMEARQSDDLVALEGAQAMLADKSVELNRTQNDLLAKTSAFEKACREASESKSSLKELGSELDASKSELAELRSKSSGEAALATEEVASLQGRFSDVHEKLKASEAHQSEKCSALHTAQVLLTEKTAELSTAHKDLQAKVSAAEKADQRISETESTLKKLESELGASRAEVAELRSKASAEAKHAAEASASLRVQFSAMQERLKASEARHSEDCSALKSAQSQLVEKADELSEVKHDMQTETFVAEKAGQRTLELENMLKTSQSELDRVMLQCDELRVAKQDHVTKASSELFSLQSRLSDTEVKAELADASLSKANHNLKSDLQRERDLVEDASLKVLELESGLSKMASELDASKSEVVELRSKGSIEAKHAAEEMASLRAQLSSLELDLKASHARQSEGCDALKATQAKLAEKHAHLIKAQEDLKAKEIAAGKSKERTAKLEDMVETSQSELGAVKQLSAMNEGEAKKALEEVASMQARLLDTEVKAKTTESSLAEENEQLMLHVQRQREESNMLSHQATKAESNLKAMRLQLDVSHAEASELRAKGSGEAKDAAQEAASLRSQLSGVQVKLQATEAQHSKDNIALKTAEAKHAEKVDELIKVQKSLQAKTFVAEQGARRISELESILQNMRSDVDASRAEVAVLSSNAASATKRAAEEVHSSNAKAASEQQELEAVISIAEERYEDQLDVSRNLEQNHAEAQARFAEELAQIRADIVTRTRESDESRSHLYEKLEGQIAQIDELKAEHAGLEQRCQQRVHSIELDMSISYAKAVSEQQELEHAVSYANQLHEEQLCAFRHAEQNHVEAHARFVEELAQIKADMETRTKESDERRRLCEQLEVQMAELASDAGESEERCRNRVHAMEMNMSDVVSQQQELETAMSIIEERYEEHIELSRTMTQNHAEERARISEKLTQAQDDMDNCMKKSDDHAAACVALQHRLEEAECATRDRVRFCAELESQIGELKAEHAGLEQRCQQRVHAIELDMSSSNARALSEQQELEQVIAHARQRYEEQLRSSTNDERNHAEMQARFVEELEQMTSDMATRTKESDKSRRFCEKLEDQMVKLKTDASEIEERCQLRTSELELGMSNSHAKAVREQQELEAVISIAEERCEEQISVSRKAEQNNAEAQVQFMDELAQIRADMATRTEEADERRGHLCEKLEGQLVQIDELKAEYEVLEQRCQQRVNTIELAMSSSNAKSFSELQELEHAISNAEQLHEEQLRVSRNAEQNHVEVQARFMEELAQIKADMATRIEETDESYRLCEKLEAQMAVLKTDASEAEELHVLQIKKLETERCKGQEELVEQVHRMEHTYEAKLKRKEEDLIKVSEDALTMSTDLNWLRLERDNDKRHAAEQRTSIEKHWQDECARERNLANVVRDAIEEKMAELRSECAGIRSEGDNEVKRSERLAADAQEISDGLRSAMHTMQETNAQETIVKDAEIASTTGIASELRDRITQLRAHFAEEMNGENLEIRSLQEERNRAALDHDVATQKISELTGEVSSLQSYLAEEIQKEKHARLTNDSELRQFVSDMTATKEQHAAALVQKHDDYEHASQACSQLSQDVEVLRVELAEEMRRRTLQNEQHMSSSKELSSRLLSEAQRCQEEYSQETDRLNVALATAENNSAGLAEHITELRSTIDDEIERRAFATSTTEQEVSRFRAEINELCAIYREELNCKETSLLDTSGHASRLTTELNCLRCELTEEVATSEKLVLASEDRCVRFESEISRLNDTVGEEIEIQACSEHNSKEALAAVVLEIDTLQKTYRQEAEDKETALDEALRNSSKLDAKAEDLQQKLVDAENSCKRAEIASAAASDELRELEERMSAERYQHEEANARMIASAMKLKASEQEAKNAESRAASFMIEITKLRGQERHHHMEVGLPEHKVITHVSTADTGLTSSTVASQETLAADCASQARAVISQVPGRRLDTLPATNSGRVRAPPLLGVRGTISVDGRRRSHISSRARGECSLSQGAVIDFASQEETQKYELEQEFRQALQTQSSLKEAAEAAEKNANEAATTARTALLEATTATSSEASAKLECVQLLESKAVLEEQYQQVMLEKLALSKLNAQLQVEAETATLSRAAKQATELIEARSLIESQAAALGRAGAKTGANYCCDSRAVPIAEASFCSSHSRSSNNAVWLAEKARTAWSAVEAAERKAAEARASLAQQVVTAEKLVADGAGNIDEEMEAPPSQAYAQGSVPPSRSIWGMAARARSERDGVHALRSGSGHKVFLRSAAPKARDDEVRAQAHCLVQAAEVRVEAAKRAAEAARDEWQRCARAAQRAEAEARAEHQHLGVVRRPPAAAVPSGTADGTFLFQACDDVPVGAAEANIAAVAAVETAASAEENVAVSWAAAAEAEAESEVQRALVAEISEGGCALRSLEERTAVTRMALDRARRAAIHRTELNACEQEAASLVALLGRLREAAGVRCPEDVILSLRSTAGVWDERRRKCMSALRGLQEMRGATMARLIEDYEVITDEARGLRDGPEAAAFLALGHADLASGGRRRDRQS